MNCATDIKIVPVDDLAEIVSSLKESGKTVVQTHGVFDIIHPGVIQHVNNAKKMGDALIVTVIIDKDVRRGPGRPVFPDVLRAENVAALGSVDYVSIVDDVIPFECLKYIKPNIFAKGQAHKHRDKRLHDKIFKEERELYFEKIEIIETKESYFSSSKIIDNFIDIYPEDTKKYIQDFSSKYSFDDFYRMINSLKDLKVLIIGDGIIDEYHYCTPMGKSAKAQLVVNKFLTKEKFAGGTFAIANHVAGICDNVTLVSLLGNDNSQENFVKKHLNPSVQTQFFIWQEKPTVIKRRFLDVDNKQKLFEVNYLCEEYISGDIEEEIMAYLMKHIPEYDLVLACDFGHGLISANIIEVLENYSKVLAVNTQTNAANTGFNLITKYKKANFICLDETETRLATQNKINASVDVAKQLFGMLNVDCLITTLGRKGAFGINRQNTHHAPIFSSKVVDTVGAGDAFFSFTAPCAARKVPLDVITFLGNAVGAIAVQIVGNKRSVNKLELLEFVEVLLSQMGN